MGLQGKHPADLCLNKGGVNCHNCGGGCGSSEEKKDVAADADLVAQITKQVMKQLGM